MESNTRISLEKVLTMFEKLFPKETESICAKHNEKFTVEAWTDYVKRYSKNKYEVC